MAPVSAPGGDPRMPLSRKLRRRGSSVTVAIPHDLCVMMSWSPGEAVEIEVVGRDAIVIRRPAKAP